MSIRRITRAVVVCGALWVSGCARPGPEFVLNLEGRDPQDVSLVQKEAITETLTRLFGTPDQPAFPQGVDLSPDLLEMAAGPVGRFADEDGGPIRERGLYRQHCAACHGISGDGAGPLASVLHPYPRDFRDGWFKYTSTASGAKPVDEDLKRALVAGNTDTAMPSFRMLPDAQIDALVEYVRYLSLRGETEWYLLRLVIDEDEFLPLDVQWVIDEGVLPAVDLWEAANEMVVQPPQLPPADAQEQLAASIVRGRKLYLSENAKCFQCHGQHGRGDGEQSEGLYDDWNKRKKGATPEETQNLAPRFRLPIQGLRPRDFTRGALRGGDRPQDVYWRIYVGIKGTPMPAAKGAVDPLEIWHLVRYIRALTEGNLLAQAQGTTSEN